MEIILIKESSKEYERMLEYVKNHPINENIENPMLATHGGEIWRYHDSVRNNDNIIIHHFVHNCHPKTNDVFEISFYGSQDISDDDILKVIKIV